MAVVAGVLGVLGGLVWLVGFSSVLATATVSVTGLDGLDGLDGHDGHDEAGEQHKVVEAAAVPIGEPLARVDTQGAADRVAQIPTVAFVTVSRSWPSTIVVSVQRRVPVIAIRDPQGRLQVVDASGVAYETVPTLPPGVTQVNASTSAPDPQGAKAAISVLQLLSPERRAQVDGVTVSTADLVTFQLGSVRVVWGGVADGPKKVVLLDALLPTNPSLIDVSAPNTPITR